MLAAFAAPAATVAHSHDTSKNCPNAPFRRQIDTHASGGTQAHRQTTTSNKHKLVHGTHPSIRGQKQASVALAQAMLASVGWPAQTMLCSCAQRPSETCRHARHQSDLEGKIEHDVSSPPELLTAPQPSSDWAPLSDLMSPHRSRTTAPERPSRPHYPSQPPDSRVQTQLLACQYNTRAINCRNQLSRRIRCNRGKVLRLPGSCATDIATSARATSASTGSHLPTAT